MGALQIKELARHDHLPNYEVDFDEEADMVILTDGDSMAPDPLVKGHVPPLQSETYEYAREVAPGWDTYRIEGTWRDWIIEPPRDADRAFTGFCRKWFKKRVRPEDTKPVREMIQVRERNPVFGINRVLKT